MKGYREQGSLIRAFLLCDHGIQEGHNHYHKLDGILISYLDVYHEVIELSKKIPHF